MYPFRHFFFGAIFSFLLFLFFPQIGFIEFFIIFLSSIFIDVDHYLYYVFRKKNISLKKSYKWFVKLDKKSLSLSKKERNNFYSGLCFLHGVEILLLLIFLSFFSIYFLYVFIGFLFHLFLDYIEQVNCHNRIDKLSLIRDFLKFKKLRHIDDE